jgi:hypothetical protein
LLGHLRLHATVLLSPAIIRLFGDSSSLQISGTFLPVPILRRLYAVWQRSDPLCDVSEPF